MNARQWSGTVDPVSASKPPSSLPNSTFSYAFFNSHLRLRLRSDVREEAHGLVCAARRTALLGVVMCVVCAGRLASRRCTELRWRNLEREGEQRETLRHACRQKQGSLLHVEVQEVRFVLYCQMVSFLKERCALVLRVTSPLSN